MLRKALTVALSLFLGAGTAFLLAVPAHAASSSCIFAHSYSYGYIGTTPDGYTGVSQTQGFALIPASSSACDKPYEGRNGECASFRLVRFYRPSTADGTTVYGPWFTSCDSPQAAASGWHGWIQQGDYVYGQARNFQFGGQTNPGGTWYN